MIEQDFERPEQFAGEDCQEVLRSTCMRDARLLTALERWDDDRARALAILRLDLDNFERAESRLEVDAMFANRQTWSGYSIRSSAVPTWSEERRKSFAEVARAIYGQLAGSPLRIRLEFDERDRQDPHSDKLPGAQQITIFHEGDPSRDPVFHGEDEVSVQTRCPALMAAIVFDPITSHLQVASKGGRRAQQNLAQAVIQAFWTDAPELEEVKRTIFALQRLKVAMHFGFDRSAGVRSVKLAAPDRGRSRSLAHDGRTDRCATGARASGSPPWLHDRRCDRRTRGGPRSS